MKKMIMLTVILLVSTVAAGCTSCKNIIPGINPTIAPTVGPSQTVTATPQPSGPLPVNFKEYETGTPPNAHMGNGVLVSHPKYYMSDNMEMPAIPITGLKQAHHGVIHELQFWNPTDDNRTIYVNYFPSAFIETYDGKGSFVSPQQIFYDQEHGFFSTFVIEPHEHRTVYIYAYISDEDYQKYKGMFKVGGMSITVLH